MGVCWGLSLVQICVAVSTILQHYDYSKPRPCVGLCYIMKLRGGPEPVFPKHPPEERTACVGMCHRDRVLHAHWSRSNEARLSLVEIFPSHAGASNLMQ